LIAEQKQTAKLELILAAGKYLVSTSMTLLIVLVNNYGKDICKNYQGKIKKIPIIAGQGLIYSLFLPNLAPNKDKEHTATKMNP